MAVDSQTQAFGCSAAPRHWLHLNNIGTLLGVAVLPQVHRAFAEHDLAPKLYNVISGEEGVQMVVMEYLVGYSRASQARELSGLQRMSRDALAKVLSHHPDYGELQLRW